jgi:dTDP-L-rhamnose 4-epimerase
MASSEKKRVLVTGGAGFVGSHTVDALLAQGHEVRVFDSLTGQVHGEGVMPDYMPREIEFVRGDMEDIDAVREAVSGVDVVFHLAAAVGVGQSMYEIARYMSANTQGTANLLQALLDRKAKVEKLIVASSMSIYGEGKYLCNECGEQSPPARGRDQLQSDQWEVQCPQCKQALTPIATDEAKPLQCTSVYALSKKDQEELCLLYGRTYGLPVVALRYFNIYGPRQALSNPYTGVAAIFAARLLNRRAPLVFEDGMQMRDFVSVHDVVAANLLAMEQSEADGIALNIGSGEPVSIREVAATLAQALGQEAQPELTGKYRAGDIRHCFADISAARRSLGYEPRHRFAEGVKELVEWLRAQSPEDRAAEAAAELERYGLTA